VPFAALIPATREAWEGGGPLRATYWLAGRTLIERQALLAADAGARRIVIMVEQLPGELVAAIDRIRAEGLEVVTARDAAEAAAAVPPGVRLLLIADGFIGARGHVERLLDDDRPLLLALPDRGFDERYERIDGDTRWAGLALIDADLLREAATMPSEWDIQSTLLRRALQTGVKPLVLQDGEAAAELAIVERPQDFAELQRRILAGAGPDGANWLGRFVLAPLERAGATAVMATPLTPPIIGGVAAALSLIAALAFAYDWRWVGLVPLLVAAPLEGIALRLARMRLQPLAKERWWRLSLRAGAAAALLALGASLARSHGWGMALLAAVTLAFMVALRQELKERRGAAMPLLADGNSLAFLLLPFAAFGQWAAGLAGLAFYATGSFFWAQYQAHRRQD
jgi:hypothetical protein